MKQTKTQDPAAQAISTNAHVVTLKDIGIEVIERPRGAKKALAEYIRALRQNWRQGTVGCKDRSEVAYSNKKPWKQKGTGRARAGSAGSPLWRHGGVIFGPQPRTRTLAVPKAMKSMVMRTLLADAVAKERVIALNYAVGVNETPRTATAFQLLKQAGLEGKKIALFTAREDAHVHGSFANIPAVRMYLFDQPNAYGLADARYWVYLKRDEQSFKEMVQLWI